ncbi:MAG TPA: multidrug efflux SMR transporter [Cytophagales bacterium]|nr:multidrug efflux SMR transporter [Cytophagales bacterium]
MNGWIYILIAAIFEIGWAIGLKYTDGLTKLWPSVGTIIAMLLSFWFLAQGTKTLPVGTAYAVWTGIGAMGTAILGMFLFNESKEIIRIVCILFIAAGVVGLKLFS